MNPEPPVISPTPPPPRNPKALWHAFLVLPKRMRLMVVTGLILVAGAGATWALIVAKSGDKPPTQGVTQAPTQSAPQDASVPAQGAPTTQNPAGQTPAPSAGGSSKPGPTVTNKNTGGTGSTGTGGAGGSGAGGASTTPPPTSSRPGASNTGVPSGTALINYSGPASNGTSGTTYSGINFPALTPGNYYSFSGNNLTFQNCKFNSGVTFSGDNIRIEHCEIVDGFSLSGTATVVAEYNNVHSFTDDGIHITSDTGQVSNVTLANNYIHSPTPGSGAHADGLQVRGVVGLTLTNNNFDMGPWFTVAGQDVLNAAVFLEGGNGGNSDITLNGNYLNGGGYILRIGSGTTFKFTDNRFGPHGHYGVVLNTSGGGTITQWTGNVMDDNGATVNP